MASTASASPSPATTLSPTLSQPSSLRPPRANANLTVGLLNHKRKRDSADPTSPGAFLASGEEGESSGRRSSHRAPNGRTLSSAGMPPTVDSAGSSFLSPNEAPPSQPARVEESPPPPHHRSHSPAPSPAFAHPAHLGHLAERNGVADPSDAASTAVAALAGIFPGITVPQVSSLTFPHPTANANPTADPDPNLDPSFNLPGPSDVPAAHDGGDVELDAAEARFGMRLPSVPNRPREGKPAVGSAEWHKMRRDNHKEVERRRRETINEGINEIAKIVPGCEKNKGSILQRAIDFITQLKDNEAQNIEKWTLEKLLTEQAIAELSASVGKLKDECERAWHEAEIWKRTCEKAGLEPVVEDADADAASHDEAASADPV
ncbi:MAG: basic helix-loop-helix protein [Phylliscum demangeonii]|nr:MAG: basic helix-loop-helix protein [Phylliscum demangeonii]